MSGTTLERRVSALEEELSHPLGVVPKLDRRVDELEDALKRVTACVDKMAGLLGAPSEVAVDVDQPVPNPGASS